MPWQPVGRGKTLATAASRRIAALVAITFLALILPAFPVSGQPTGSGPTGQPAAPAAASPAVAADSAAAARKAEAVPTPTTQDTLGRPKSRADTVLVVQHSFNHRQQIITGSVVMSCLAMMLVIMNNYNPR